MNRCPCKSLPDKVTQHFEIPPLMSGVGRDALLFIGSTDREVSYHIYYNRENIKYHKYKRNQNKPYVYVERTPNQNGMYDC